MKKMFPEFWLVKNRMGTDTGTGEKESKLHQLKCEAMESEWNRNDSKNTQRYFKNILVFHRVPKR